MTPAGIEPATLRFVAEHLNHCANAVPGGSSTVHIYTQTIHRTTQSTQTEQRTTQLIHKTTQFCIYNLDAGLYRDICKDSKLILGTERLFLQVNIMICPGTLMDCWTLLSSYEARKSTVNVLY